MGDLVALMDSTLSLFKIKFTIYGYTMSFWEIFLWVILAGIVVGFIGGFFGGD